MRTFHIGGAASRTSAASNIQVKHAGRIRLHNLKFVQQASGHLVAVSRSGELALADQYGRERERYKLPYGATLALKDGDEVVAGQIVATWDPHTHPIVTEVNGVAQFVDMIEGLTMNRQVDEVTGLTSIVIIDSKQRSGLTSSGRDVRAMIKLVDEKGNDIMLAGTQVPAHYYLPVGAVVNVEDGMKINIGDVIARIPQESSKTRDITGE